MNIKAENLVQLAIVAMLLLGCISTKADVEKKYRIAFVKQVVYQDLYCTNATNPTDIVFSTFRRSGPVGLFSALTADFYIVNTEQDPECEIWKEKAICQKGIAYYESLKTAIPPDGKLSSHTHPQGYYAVPCASINWGNYDIVISMDIAVPERMVKRYPHTLWAYYIGEGVQQAYNSSFDQPIAGYDVFLTQDFGTNPVYKKHVIDFPYHLHYYGCFHDLLGSSPHYQREGIFLDTHTHRALSEDQKKQLNKVSAINAKTSNLESYTSMIARLSQTKYFLVYLKPKADHRTLRRHREFRRCKKVKKHRVSLRGNAIPEAIAAGNLVIAQKNCLQNTSLLSEKTIVNSFQELIAAIEYFEKNPCAYKEELEQQQKKLNWYCFDRPMKELYEQCERKKAAQDS